MSLNRTYNLRFEAIGDRLRLHVDGRLMLEVEDTSFERGHVGLMMYKTAVEYDNVLLNHEPLLPMIVDGFDSNLGLSAGRWSEEGQGSWSYRNDTATAYVQSSLAGIARSITGVNVTTDQMVETRVRPSAFASGGVRWFGLIARYVDPNNYYYVTVRSDNTISLRKLVNGAIHILDTAPLTVSTGTSYRLRLEAIEDKVRVFVNGRHVLEAVDATFAHGRYGLATYKTSAQFDDFLAVQP